MIGHRTSRILVLATPALLVLLHMPAMAQSLGAVAKAEEARRKAIPATKVYTNDNLPAAEAPPAGVVAPASEAAAAPAQTGTSAASDQPADRGKDADAKPVEKKDEAYWRKRMQTEREALSRAESFSLALQSRINALSADFVNRDDPAQRNVIASDRQKALAELDRLKKEIVDRNKAIATIQQEARRANVPASWVR